MQHGFKRATFNPYFIDRPWALTSRIEARSDDRPAPAAAAWHQTSQRDGAAVGALICRTAPEPRPIERYDESAESAQAYEREHAELLGDDPFALEEIMGCLPASQFAARAA